MKVHAPIGFFFLNSVIGVLVFSNSYVNAARIQGLYVLDDNNVPTKIDFSEFEAEPNLEAKDMPERVFFYLHTRDTWENPEKLYVDDINSLANSHLNLKKPTKFVTHGWTQSRKNSACTLVRDAFLRNGDYNVIVVDWSSISKRPYVWTSNQVLKVAQFVSRMIDFLYTQGLKPSQLTLVGHSLGAHIAGLASYYAKTKASYVVALDPAGPNFYLNGQGTRVSRNDALHVQVIHTSKLLGLTSEIGESDFYPNGGLVQKGCKVDIGGSCSHSRSYEYFAESLNSNGFLARSCNSLSDYEAGRCNSNPIAHMGGVVPDPSAKGRYYLTTNSEAPYAKNSV